MDTGYYLIWAFSQHWDNFQLFVILGIYCVPHAWLSWHRLSMCYMKRLTRPNKALLFKVFPLGLKTQSDLDSLRQVTSEHSFKY